MLPSALPLAHTTAAFCCTASVQFAAMAMLTLASSTTFAASSCSPSSRFATSGVAATSKPATLLTSAGSPSLSSPLTTKLTNATSLRLLQSGLGSPKQAPERRWSCQSGSTDRKVTEALRELKDSEVKAPLKEEEETGPPFLTILAGIFMAALVFGALWSLLSAIVGFFFR